MGDVDMISRLPTDLLVSILSRLTLKEATTTSILSCQWENLWTFYHGSIDFNIPKMFDELGCSYYAGVVNKVLDTFESVKGGDVFDSFSIPLHSCPNILSSVDRCVQFALEKRKAKRLEIGIHLFSDRCSEYECGKSYDFPSPKGFYTQRSNIHTLTYICFVDVNVSSEIIEHFLSNCPDLQSLVLMGLDKPLVHLRVSGETLSLRHLDISGCLHLTTVEISAPNLVSLYCIFQPTIAKFYVRNTPKMVELSSGLLETSILSCFPHIQKLELSVPNIETGDLIKFTELNSVKHLTLRFTMAYDQSILAWTPMFKAFPVLQRLTLDMRCRSYDRINGINEIIRDEDKFPCKCLKVLEFLGFGEPNDSELVMYFINNIGPLEKIILRRDDVAIWSRRRDVEKPAKLAAELKEMIPKEVNLEFFGRNRFYSERK